MSTARAAAALATTPDLDDLRDAVARPGPFASVLVAYDAPAEDTAAKQRLRWRSLATELGELGAPDETVTTLERAIADAPGSARACAAVAAGTDLAMVKRHFEEPASEYVRWSAVPSLVPVIEWRQLTPAHVVVLVDRTGADLFVSTPEDGSFETETEGDHDEIHKPQAGGWSHRRFQERAEDSWERNAEEVAADVTRLAGRVDAALVVVAGDPTATGLVRQALGPNLDATVETLDHGSRDAGLDSIGDDVLHRVATRSAEDTVAVLEAWKEEAGRHERAADGPEPTVEALASGRVQTLLVHDDADDERVAFVGPEPAHVAVDAGTLRDMGVDTVERVRLTDACVRAALGTGADVRVVPAHGGPDDGVGALLRWAS